MPTYDTLLTLTLLYVSAQRPEMDFRLVQLTAAVSGQIIITRLTEFTGFNFHSGILSVTDSARFDRIDVVGHLPGELRNVL